MEIVLMNWETLRFLLAVAVAGMMVILILLLGYGFVSSWLEDWKGRKKK